MKLKITKIETGKAFRNELCAIVKSYGDDQTLYVGINIEEWDDVTCPELFIHCSLSKGINCTEFENKIKEILSRHEICGNESVDNLQISDRFFDENIFDLDFIEQTLAGKTDYAVEKLDDDLWRIEERYYLIKCN